MVSVYFYTLFYFEERRFKKYIKLKKFIETDKKSIFFIYERRFLCLKKQQFKERFQVQ